MQPTKELNIDLFIPSNKDREQYKHIGIPEEKQQRCKDRGKSEQESDQTILQKTHILLENTARKTNT